MKRILALLLAALLIPPMPADAATEVEGKQVMYVGGTIPNLPEGTMGTLDMTQRKVLVFESAGGRVEIPYADIRAVEHREKLAHRFGAVTTLAVVIVRRRHRKHYVDINYVDAEGNSQAVVFEVSKTHADTVRTVLNTRCPSKTVQMVPQYPYAPPAAQPKPTTTGGPN